MAAAGPRVAACQYMAGILEVGDHSHADVMADGGRLLAKRSVSAAVERCEARVYNNHNYYCT